MQNIGGGLLPHYFTENTVVNWMNACCTHSMSLYSKIFPHWIYCRYPRTNDCQVQFLWKCQIINGLYQTKSEVPFHIYIVYCHLCNIFLNCFLYDDKSFIQSGLEFRFTCFEMAHPRNGTWHLLACKTWALCFIS